MTIAKAPAGAPPVLWVIIRKTGTLVDSGTFRSERAAKADAKLWDAYSLYGHPHRVVAYVPRDTPC